MVLLALLTIACSFAVALVTTGLVLRASRRIGAVDPTDAKGQVRFSSRRVPNTGGIAIFAAIASTILGGVFVASISQFDALPGGAADLKSLVTDRIAPAGWMLGCAACLHFLGLIDDRRPIPAMLKLALIISVSLAAVLLTDSRLLTMLDSRLGTPVPSIVVTVLWIVAITNAMNFIDNMDGLCAGVAAIAGACFMSACLVNHQWFIALTLAAVVGASLGFLVFNFPPAKLYMGDSGSLVLGFLLALMTVRTTYYQPDEGAFDSGAWYALFMPLVVLAVPIYDLTSVVAIRISQGKSPFVGDTQHFSHRLVKRGLSPRAAVGVILGVTAITGITGVMLASLEPWQAVLAGVQVAVIFLVLAIMERKSSPLVQSVHGSTTVIKRSGEEP